MSSAVIYVIIMAVAFVAFVCLATILFLTRKKEREELPEEEYEEEAYSARKTEKKVQKQDDDEDYPDEPLPQERADYGYSELNPIFTTSTTASERYLAALRTERGEGLRWIREGTVTVKKLNQKSNVNVEYFSLYLNGKPFKKIFICPTGRNSSYAPKGMRLATDGKRLSYNGCITSEALEKGITEEQVLEKYALIYERKQAENSANRKNNTSHTGVKKTEPADFGTVAYKPASGPAEEKQSAAKPEAVSFESAPARKSEEKEKRPASFPKYLPGFEPEEMKPALEKFLAVMDRAYPDGVIQGSTWDHDRWDRAASMLCKYLGYANGSDFLEAYGYTVEK